MTISTDDQIEYYAPFGREPVAGISSEIGDLLRQLGFLKVRYNCVYEGPVAKFVEALKGLGWWQPGHPNKFLLTDGTLCANWAADTDVPSDRFIAIFWGPSLRSNS